MKHDPSHISSVTQYSIPRIIGTYGGNEYGPLVVVIAGLHGNEPAGVEALKRVFRALHYHQPAFTGKLLGLAGNVPALEACVRYVDMDLNRLWSPEQIQRIKTAPKSGQNTEEQQLMEILEAMESELEKDYSDRILLDLHTTSGPNGLFSIATHRPQNRELASALHAPILFGLATSLSSTINRYMEDQGILGVAFEAGQHEHPNAISNHEAAIWLILEKALCINHTYKEADLDPFHERLIVASRHLPHYVQVIYRHAITEADHFHMYPGFINFHQVYKGEPLARSASEIVSCPQTGLILMPLYQKQGHDGFFIVEKLDEPPV